MQDALSCTNVSIRQKLWVMRSRTHTTFSSRLDTCDRQHSLTFCDSSNESIDLDFKISVPTVQIQ